MSGDSVTVVTPTTGHRRLDRCLASVQRQTHGAVTHLVVVDGPDHEPRVDPVVRAVTPRHPLHVLRLPQPTGRDGYLGHRAYGAALFLVATEYVCFLDEDNWFDADHVASLVAAVTGAGADWGFALRKIVDQDGEFIAYDNCDSLGDLHPTYDDERQHLVDTSCYLLRTALAVSLAPVWHRRCLTPGGPPPPDRALFAALLDGGHRPASTRRHTVNYAVANRAGSTSAQWFLTGNAVMARRYPDGLPWE